MNLFLYIMRTQLGDIPEKVVIILKSPVNHEFNWYFERLAATTF